MYEKPPESTLSMTLPVLSAPSSYGQHIRGAVSAPGLSFTPSCTELLGIVVYKTDEKKKVTDAWYEDVVVIALENSYPS